MGRHDGRRLARCVVLCCALAAWLVGVTAAAAHEHAGGADYAQTCALCAVGHAPQQGGDAVKAPEPAPPTLVAPQVFPLASANPYRPACSCLSRAPPA